MFALYGVSKSNNPTVVYGQTITTWFNSTNIITEDINLRGVSWSDGPVALDLEAAIVRAREARKRKND